MQLRGVTVTLVRFGYLVHRSRLRGYMISILSAVSTVVASLGCSSCEAIPFILVRFVFLLITHVSFMFFTILVHSTFEAWIGFCSYEAMFFISLWSWWHFVSCYFLFGVRRKHSLAWRTYVRVSRLRCTVSSHRSSRATLSHPTQLIKLGCPYANRC